MKTLACFACFVLCGIASSPVAVGQTLTWLTGTLNARPDLPGLYFAETIGIQFLSVESMQLEFRYTGEIGNFDSVNFAFPGYYNPSYPNLGNIGATVNLSSSYRGTPFTCIFAGATYPGTFPSASGTIMLVPEPSTTCVAAGLATPFCIWIAVRRRGQR